MSNDISFSYQINPLWESVKHVRDEVNAILHGKSEELIDACKMTASELIENAVKYGNPIEKNAGIQFELALHGSHVRILVSNKIRLMDDFNTFISIVHTIQDSENTKDLYINRLKTLMEDPKIINSRLGLFRIAYEGGFNLDYTCEAQVLSVIATRKLTGDTP